MSILTPYLQAFPRFGHFVGGLGGDPAPPPSFTDFDDINTLFWYSLHPSASRVSSVSIGSGVSQITGVNTGPARNATQATGSLQPSYSATGLNGFPCISGLNKELNLPTGISLAGCAVLAVVQIPASYPAFVAEYFGVGSFQSGTSNSLFAGQIQNPTTGLDEQGVGIAETGISNTALSTASGVGVAFWFADDGAWRTSWNGGIESTSSDVVGVPLESWTIGIYGNSAIKLGEFVVIASADSTLSNIAQAVNILKSRWGIA